MEVKCVKKERKYQLENNLFEDDIKIRVTFRDLDDSPSFMDFGGIIGLENGDSIDQK